MNARKTLKANDKGRLEIGGADCGTLVKEFGTPLYVFDEKYIETICETFNRTLKENYGDGIICYASKAFCCKEIYKVIDKFELGADSVSQGEIYTALKAGFDLKKLYFHGNNKTPEEIDFAVKNGVGVIIIDSFSEADELNAAAEKYGVIQSVLIRINPGVEAHTHHFVQTAKPDSKFGFSISNGQAEEIIDYCLTLKNIKLCGLHCHIGSQIFEKKSFCLAIDKMTDFYKKLKDEKGIEFDTLNLGGGFGIWYADGDAAFTPEEYADYVKNICVHLDAAVKEKGLKKPYLVLEPGRSIVGEAGITLYTVGAVKEIKGLKKYAAIDGGMFENPRFALYQARYTVAAALKMNEKPTEKYTIAGKCCESGDIIAEDCLLPEIKKGDILAVFSTGAYNYSMASNYNRNAVPPVIFVKDGKARYVVKPQTLDDLIRNDV